MASAGLHISYRTIRLGWCIRDNNWDDLRSAIRLSHTLWGGRFNPLIPVDNAEQGAALIKLYRVDALYPLAEEKSLENFIAKFPWLPWPTFQRQLFMFDGEDTVATFLDVYHVVRDLVENQLKHGDHPESGVTLFEWDPSDPLRDVFLAYFGGYPPPSEISKDYSALIEEHLLRNRIRLTPTSELDPAFLDAITPSTLTTHLVEWDSIPRWGNPGVYVGDADNFEDIVNFWNLRAAHAELVFYDPKHQNRLQRLTDVFVERHVSAATTGFGSDKAPAVWYKKGGHANAGQFGRKGVVYHEVTDGTWNGLNLKPARFHIGRSRSSLGTTSDVGHVRELSIQLPEKPFFDELELHEQHVVVELSSIGLFSDQGESTYRIPFLPVLNEFYGRRMCFNSRIARVGIDGLGLIESIRTNHFNLRSVSTRELIIEMFRVFGMKSEVSAPGRIAYRLIQQMGGIQKCRVFKIPGVRDLLEAYGPQEPFERTNAIYKIGRSDPVTGRPNFGEYENLYIEQRESGPLKPEQAFLFLLKQGVFQVGLGLSCPHCELDPWVPLDGLGDEVRCEYCGKTFLITPQLRDRNWKYRRSGLFGRENNQEGSVPVALTLQQMHTVLSMAGVLFLTNMTIEPTTARVEHCETDFVLIQQRLLDDRVSIAIGECKTRQEITGDDVRKLALVANVFEENGLNSFIVFSKLAPFTPAEIERCQAIQLPHRRRVIMLTDRELEPYFIYERTAIEFAIRSSPISLQHLADITDGIFFHPNRRQIPGTS